MVYPTKFNEMKKLIDIPEEIVKDLKKMAIDADKDLKNFHKYQIEAVKQQWSITENNKRS